MPKMIAAPKIPPRNCPIQSLIASRGVICLARYSARLRIGLATAPITPIAIAIAKPKPRADLERADRPTAQDDQPWAAEHHDRRSGELGRDQSDCAELGHVVRAYPRRVLGLVTCSAARALDTDLPLLLAELPEATDRHVGRSHGRLVRVRCRRDPLDVGLPRPPGAVLGLGAIRRRGDGTVESAAAHRVERRQAIPARAGGERHPDRADADRGCRRRASAVSRGHRREAGRSEPARSACAGSSDDPAGAHEHIDVLHARGAVAMVQQYVSAVDAHGETGMVFIGGDYSHAFRKEPILASTIRIGR